MVVIAEMLMCQYCCNFRGGKKRKGVEVYDSDDERAYRNEKIPDPRSEEYFNDEVDEFHANRDKVYSANTPFAYYHYDCYVGE